MLTYQEYKGKVRVKVIGKGSWVESKSFMNFCLKKFKEGKKMYIDLSNCQILDSTFLGTIASFSIKKNRIYLFNIKSPHIWRSLKSLGIAKVVPVLEDFRLEFPKEVKEWEIPPQSITRKEEMEVIANAHKTLVEVIPENISRFKDVLELLEKEEKKKINLKKGGMR